MAGIRLFEEQLRLMTPHTYAALQRLVMAMTDYVNNVGKTTFFGRDKGHEAYSRFLVALKTTVQALVIDAVVAEANTTEEVLTALEEKLQKFSMAFPNWPEAYTFAAELLGEKRPNTVAVVERLRSMP